MSTEAEDTPEARAVCEHFYASHCYRGMSIRLCMLCHEPDWDELAEQLRGAAPPVAAALEATQALPGMESLAPVPGGPAAAATAPAAPSREHLRHLISDAIEVAWWSGTQASVKVMEVAGPLLDRAKAAEARLDAVFEYCQTYRGDEGMTLACEDILAIIGSDEEAGRG